MHEPALDNGAQRPLHVTMHAHGAAVESMNACPQHPEGPCSAATPPQTSLTQQPTATPRTAAPPAVFTGVQDSAVATGVHPAGFGEGFSVRERVAASAGDGPGVSAPAHAVKCMDTSCSAGCADVAEQSPIPAEVLEKVQEAMGRHKYSAFRVLPGGQSQMLAEAAVGKQFVYFSPPGVSPMIVVERTRSDSD